MEKSEIFDMVHELVLLGYGVAWNPVYKKFWPFSVDDGECINWWHDPGKISSSEYSLSIKRLHRKIYDRKFSDHLISSSKIVDTWPEWKKKLLGGTKPNATNS